MGRFSAPAPGCIRERKVGVKVDRIVIHAMDGSLKGTEAWFKNASRPTLSCTHYLIGRDGEIVQMAPDDKRCIHAGSTLEPNWNDRSLGIEHEVRCRPWRGPFPANEWTEPMLVASAKVTVILCRKFGIPLDREHIVGHSEVPHRPTDAFHTDPGDAFPWARYMEMIAAAS